MGRGGSRGRHVRRTPLRERLLRRRRRRDPAAQVAVLTVDVRTLEDEVARLRPVEATAMTDSTAAAVVVELRLQQAEYELAEARAEAAGLHVEVVGLSNEVAGLRAEHAGLRAELAAVREELVWAFAERRVLAQGPAATAVVDLTAPRVATA